MEEAAALGESEFVSIQGCLAPPLGDLAECIKYCMQGRRYPVPLKGGTLPTSTSSSSFSFSLCISAWCVCPSAALVWITAEFEGAVFVGRRGAGRSSDFAFCPLPRVQQPSLRVIVSFPSQLKPAHDFIM